MATARKTAARKQVPVQAGDAPTPSDALAKPGLKRPHKAGAVRANSVAAPLARRASLSPTPAVRQFETGDQAVGEIVRSACAQDPTAGGQGAVRMQVGGLSPVRTPPGYWEQACADLVERDRILKKLIPQFGPVHLITRGDPFVTLARSVVGQQISVKAAQAVWDRIETACPQLAPQPMVALGFERLAGCGLSRRKAEYILDLAEHFISGALHVNGWAAMEDEAVIADLTQIRGIGRWTAEMFLIFNLMRPDVLPLDDAGLIRAISVNYFSGEPVTRSEAREVAANWEPWRTVATWYMWRSLDPLPVDY